MDSHKKVTTLGCNKIVRYIKERSRSMRGVYVNRHLLSSLLKTFFVKRTNKSGRNKEKVFAAFYLK